MTTRILALVLSLVLCCSLLAGCSGDSGENQPAGGTTTGGANVTTTTVTEADGTTTTTVTTTESLTVQTDKDGNTVILDGNGNVIATGGEGDTVVTNADGSIVITDDKGSTVVITTSTTVNTTTTKAEPSQNGSSTTPTTTTKPDESKPTEPSGGDDPVDDPVKLYTGILPGSAQAGTAFSTLAKAPKDNTVTVANDTKQFGRFLLTTSDNKALPFNIACHMEGDRITALVPADVDLSKIKANFTYYGKNVTYNGADLISRSTVMDLTKDVTLTLNAKDGSSRQVTVHIEKLATGLPSMSMTTSGYSAITSTAEYKSAAFSIGGGDKAICSYATADQTKGADCSVKGRGNTSWGYAKKSYTLRFDTKYSLLGLPESKNYVLLALYADQSLMRYRLGEYLSESMGLEYTMNLRYVDLWLNGEYVGVYGLVEKIEVEKNRVNITDYVSPAVPANEIGYLLEFDDHLYTNASEAQRKNWTAMGTHGLYDPAINEVFFRSTVLGENWIMIRTTNAKNLTNTHVDYIYLVVESAMKALKSGNYADITKWIDVESFTKWYLIEEYLNNTDTDMTSSVYMYIDVGGKLKLGPLWDMDNAAGNHTATTSTTAHALFDSKNGWFSYLFKCPEAKKVLKDQWAKMQGVIAGVDSTLDATAKMLEKAAEVNFTRWELLGTNMSSQPADIAKADTFKKQVSYLKDFLKARATALDAFYKTL